MKTYVLTVSERFPAKHKRAGDPTFFVKLIADGMKKHTIRGNYDLWKKRIDEVMNGEAILSVRTWSGKPYRSKQIEQFTYEYISGIGIQKLQADPYLGWFVDDLDSNVTGVELAKNDGLSWDDFKEWFKGADLSKPMAMIHFTDFRY